MYCPRLCGQYKKSLLDVDNVKTIYNAIMACFLNFWACLINSEMHKKREIFSQDKAFFRWNTGVFRGKITQYCGKISAFLGVLSFIKQALIKLKDF